MVFLKKRRARKKRIMRRKLSYASSFLPKKLGVWLGEQAIVFFGQYCFLYAPHTMFLYKFQEFKIFLLH
jgi:hypothetical protein